MLVSVALSLLLAAASPPATAAPANANCSANGGCPDSSMNVTLPDSQTAPAANIHLQHFEYTIPGSFRGNTINFDDMLGLMEKLKVVAATSLASSQSSYGIRLRYTLTADRPAAMQMQVAGDAAREAPHLKQFFNRASALKAFHSGSGTVYVQFEYGVTPAAAGRKTKGR